MIKFIAGPPITQTTVFVHNYSTSTAVFYYKYLSVANKEKYGTVPPSPENFWNERRENKYKHICDHTITKLKKKHSKELVKIKDRESAVKIGTLLMGDFYLDGFNSRSCSSHMAQLVGQGTDYLDFYCGSGQYYNLKVEQMLKKNATKKVK